MAEKVVVHFMAHHCGPQECDCEPICRGRAADPFVTSTESRVTCKTCLRNLASRRAKIEAQGVAYKAELYDEVWSLAKTMGYENVTDALMDLKKFSGAKP